MKRIGLLGCGAIGTQIAIAIDTGMIPAQLTHIFDSDVSKAESLVTKLKQKPEIVENAHLLSSNHLDLVVTENLKDVANYGLNCLSENFETGDLGHLQWKTAGNADWFVQSKVTSGSKFAAQSGSIGDGQSTSLILQEDFTGGEGSFEVRVNSERTWDKLVFLVDDRKILEWSGIQVRGKYSFNITPGKHLLEWRYQKDFANSFGEDSAWLDNLDLPLRVGASLALEKNGDSARLRLWGRPGHRYDIEVSTDFSGWAKWDSVFIDSEGVKLLIKDIKLNASTTRFFRAVAP